jgi:hypothetical protein
MLNRQTNKQTNRQTDKQTNRQTDKQTNRQTDKEQRAAILVNTGKPVLTTTSEQWPTVYNGQQDP